MSGRRSRGAALAVAAVAMLVLGPEAQAVTTPIATCGQTVTTNAVLTKDLVCSGPGIVVGASGITVDLKGFTLRGNRSMGNFGVDAFGGYDKVTIKNGVVRNFYYGVAAAGTRIAISNLVASGNGSIGLYVLGDAASVRSSSADGNRDSGIYITGNAASLVSVTAAGNSAGGIVVLGDSATVTGATALGNVFDGITVAGAAPVVTSSKVAGNAETGIRVSGDAARITGNRSDGNGFAAGASDLFGFGIWGYFSTSAPKGSNVARGNDDIAECTPGSLC